MSTILILREGVPESQNIYGQNKNARRKNETVSKWEKAGRLRYGNTKHGVEYQKTIRSRNKPIREAKTYILYTFLTSYYFVCSLKGI